MSLRLVCVGLLLGIAANCTATTPHPRLLLSEADVNELRQSIEDAPLFAESIRRTQAKIARLLTNPPDIPIPTDPGGGYTHERHKANGYILAEAGALYQWTQDPAYAKFVKDLLLLYAELYAKLGPHPVDRSSTRGRMFWQTLNESVWLTQAIQGYDAILPTLSAQERSAIETNLFRPIATFLSVDSSKMFDRIHNHATWAAAAVGMTGLVLGDEVLIDRALMGTNGDGTTGFLAQLSQLFSPAGYYLEGPYYQRYAIMPFVIFARSISLNMPEVDIFSYREGIVKKAITTTIQLTYNSKFIPINDALLEKGLDTMELDRAIAIGYGITGDPSFASLIDDQSTIPLIPDALRLTLAKAQGAEQPFAFSTQYLRDGGQGNQGALAVLRAGPTKDTALVFKATSHGLSHGHFDRLHWMLYDNGNTVVSDYGAARFLNVEQKRGGRYLPENLTWAKQTVAHNTLVVDEQSQFDAHWQTADLSWPEEHFSSTKPNAQLVAASENKAFEDTSLRRTMLLIESSLFEYPVVMDLFQARSTDNRRYDLPLYLRGNVIEYPSDLETANRLSPVGKSNGYQHLWQVGSTPTANKGASKVTTLIGNRFYTHWLTSRNPYKLVATQIGANDPEFNLRAERGFLYRFDKNENLDAVAILEPHGMYDSAREFTSESGSQIKQVHHERIGQVDYISLSLKQNANLSILISHDTDPHSQHEITVNGQDIRWTGYFQIFETN